jgi:basic membrane protein A
MSNKAITQMQGVIIAAILIVAIVIGSSAYWVSTVPSETTTATETRTNTVTQTTTRTSTTTSTVTQTTTMTTTLEPNKIRVGMVFRSSPEVENFGLSIKQGLDKAKELYGIEWTGIEWVGIEERERTFRNLAAEGYDLIINDDTAGWDLLLSAAADYPDTYFATVLGASDIDVPPNVVLINPGTLDGAYLGGMLVGGMTETNKIGWPVAFIYPLMSATVEAFKMGAKSVNPDAQVFVIETFTWVDAVKGKEAADALIDQGCDMLSHFGGAPDVGVVQAAAEHDLVTVISDATLDAKDFYEKSVALFTYRVDLAVTHVVGLLVNGNLEGGEYTGGLKDFGWSDIELIHPEWIPDDLLGKIYKARYEIQTGELVIPFISELGPP